ncbi:MAG: phage major capsid protein [Verrucomicrobiaceae bacterium]|nr:MAG: phage major capsid protein [Verrucomicrobiaceae bacterium]
MFRFPIPHTIGGTLLLMLIGTLQAADQPNPAELRMREQLRSTTLQLRTIQGERDALNAAKTQLESEKKTLTEQVEKLTKESAAEKTAANKTIAEVEAKVAQQATEIAQLQESLEKWKKAHGEVSTVAQKKEAERGSLAAQKIELDRLVADQRRKNLEMFKIGNDILDRYKNFGLGTALGAREPFVGTTRVKLQNLVQDYKDKLAEQRIKSQP